MDIDVLPRRVIKRKNSDIDDSTGQGESQRPKLDGTPPQLPGSPVLPSLQQAGHNDAQAQHILALQQTLGGFKETYADTDGTNRRAVSPTRTLSFHETHPTPVEPSSEPPKITTPEPPDQLGNRPPSPPRPGGKRDEGGDKSGSS